MVKASTGAKIKIILSGGSKVRVERTEVFLYVAVEKGARCLKLLAIVIIKCRKTRNKYFADIQTESCATQ